MQIIDAKNIDYDKMHLIDVRTPGEFAEGSIPHSINLPIFTNEEHCEIGTLYKTHREESYGLAVKYASYKLPAIYERVKDLTKDKKQVVFYCAKGGLRSRFLTENMALVHLFVGRIDGGYKAYRKEVTTILETWFLNKKAITLQGYTGAGKTFILNELQRRGLPVLDLEGLASHRGSVFGSMGLAEQPTQKNFEGSLYLRCKELQESPYFIVEAESPKIGRLFVPKECINALRKGDKIFIDTDILLRVNNIYNEYLGTIETADQVSILKKLNHIKGNLKKEVYDDMVQALHKDDYKTLIELLLIHYYDGLYDYSIKKHEYKEVVPFTNLKTTTNHIENSIKEW